jgi:hypothetical protein
VTETGRNRWIRATGGYEPDTDRHQRVHPATRLSRCKPRAPAIKPVPPLKIDGDDCALI